MGAITPLHLIIVLVVALLVLGPGKLPEVGAALGKTIREFRKATTEVQEATSLAPTPSIPPVASVVPAPVAPAPAPAAAPAPAPVAAGPAPAPAAVATETAPPAAPPES